MSKELETEISTIASDEVPLTFSAAISRRTEVPIDDVEAILRKYEIDECSVPEQARHLSVRFVRFSGTKLLEGGTQQAFSFDWDTSNPGMYVVISPDNLIGKSTILQVILWALRGAIKNLSGPSLAWIQHVEVGFLVDGKSVDVVFDSKGEDVVGQATVIEADGATQSEFKFADRNSFKITMESVMMKSLGFSRIHASRKDGESNLVQYTDGWLAYTGAFLSDSRTDALLGEFVQGTSLTQRLLQVFIGVPWAQTSFKAMARARDINNEDAKRRARLRSIGGRSIADLEAAIAEARAAIDSQGQRHVIVDKLNRKQEEFRALTADSSQCLVAVFQAEQQVQAAELAQRLATRRVNELKEISAASEFLGSLKPTCCPRCSKPISEARIEAEVSDHSCSVCTEVIDPVDPLIFEGEVAEAKSRLKSADDHVKATRKFLETWQAKNASARKKLEVCGEELSALAALGTAADVLVLKDKLARLEGNLEIVEAVENASLIDEIERKVLLATEDEAKDRAEAASVDAFGKISAEVTRICKELGMKNLQSIRIKRNATVDIDHGGVVDSFGKLSPGEQLRIRLATIIAMVSGLPGMRLGRHPGLLLIDSPGKEEVARESLNLLLLEMLKAVKNVPNLQIFVAMATSDADPFGDGPNVRRIPSGEYAW